MKRILSFFLVVILLLGATSCGQEDMEEAAKTTESTHGEGIAPVSYMPEFPRRDQTSGQFIETEQGYYKLENEMIMFCPAGENTFFKLCGKPDCNHSDENCNAYGGLAIGYYDGQLYSALLSPEGDCQLVRMNPDGTEHEIVCVFPMPVYPDGTSGGGLVFHFCNGAVYHILQGKIYSYYRADLKTGKITQHFTDTEDLSSKTVCMGLKVAVDPAEPDIFYADYYDGPTDTYRLARLDWANDTIEVLDAFINTPCFAVDNGTLYYYCNPSNSYGYAYDGESGFIEYNYAEGVARRVFDPGVDGESARFDDTYIYLRERMLEDSKERVIYVYDYDYQLVDKLVLDKSLCYFCTANNKIYLIDVRFSTYKIVCYFERSQLGTGEIELVPVSDGFSVQR